MYYDEDYESSYSEEQLEEIENAKLWSGDYCNDEHDDESDEHGECSERNPFGPNFFKTMSERSKPEPKETLSEAVELSVPDVQKPEQSAEVAVVVDVKQATDTKKVSELLPAWFTGTQGIQGQVSNTSLPPPSEQVKESSGGSCLMRSDWDSLRAAIRAFRANRYALADAIILGRHYADQAMADQAEAVVREVYNEAPMPVMPEMSPAGLANYCIDALDDKIRLILIPEKPVMYQPNGTWRIIDSLLEVKRKLYLCIEGLPALAPTSKEKDAFSDYVRKHSLPNSIWRSMILSQRFKTHKTQEFDQHLNLLGVENGVLDLDHLTLIQDPKEKLLTKQANFKFLEQQPCPVFERFIHDICCGDTEMVRYMQAMIGYILHGANDERLFFMYVGDGRNGKSTLLTLLYRLLGNYATAIALKTLLKATNKGVGDDIVSLAGCRLLMISELDKNDSFNSALVKSITGKDPIKARALYTVYDDFFIQGKIIIATNEIPVIDDASEGIWDRLRILTFNYRVPKEKEDPDLLNKLINEGAGILWWALQGYHFYLKDRSVLNDTRAMRATKQRVRYENDPLKRFLDERYQPSLTNWVQTTQLVSDFNHWMKHEGMRPIANIKHTVLKERLPRLGFTYKKNTKGSGYLMELKPEKDGNI